jgi:hypothetical protein
MIHDANEYALIRQRLLKQATIDEHKRAARMAKQYGFHGFDVNIDPLIKEKILKRRDKEKSIFLHYTHEKRFFNYKRTIHELWTQTFRDTTVEETRLIVGTRNNPNLTRELVRRCPQSSRTPKTLTRNTI